MKSILILASLLMPATLIRGDDPELLAKDFTQLAKTVAALKVDSTYEGFKQAQRHAIPLYRDFLVKHPESVYANKVRWSLYSAYLTLEWHDQANMVLDDIQDALLQEFLRISFAQRGTGRAKGSQQILEGILETCEDGGIRARTAQFLFTTGETKRALELLDQVIGSSKYRDDVRARALLIKADLYRSAREVPSVIKQRISLLKELVKSYPKTRAGEEGKRKLAAAQLREGSDALPFSVTAADGTAVTLASLKGKTVLLYFWASWAYPSWRHVGQLKKAVRELTPGSVVVLGVACDTFVERPKLLWERQGLTWPLVAEGNGWHSSLARLYDVETVPYYVLINAEGKVVMTGTMRVDALKAHLARAL